MNVYMDGCGWMDGWMDILCMAVVRKKKNPPSPVSKTDEFFEVVTGDD